MWLDVFAAPHALSNVASFCKTEKKQLAVKGNYMQHSSLAPPKVYKSETDGAED